MQSERGLKRILSFARIYDLCQFLIGAKHPRTWLAENFWKVQAGQKIVDVGCGPGTILDHLPPGITYVGFDISENYIRAAREEYGGRGMFLAGTARDFLNQADSPLSGADLVVCNGLLHHLDDGEAIEVLELSKQVLRPGGRLVCFEGSFLAHQTWLSRWFMGRDRGKSIRSEREWKALAGRAFPSFETHIVTGIVRLPWVAIVIECRKGP